MGAGGTIDVRALADLVPLLGTFEITLPGDLVVLMRALITLDGTLGVLSPGFSVISAGKQLAQDAAQEQMDGDPNEILQQALIAELPVLRRLPGGRRPDPGVGVTGVAADPHGGGGGRLPVHPHHVEPHAAGGGRRSDRAGVRAADGPQVGPRLGGDTRLVVVLGAGGLFFSVGDAAAGWSQPWSATAPPDDTAWRPD